jgi:CubicO group peptidase (beta-lactamase class C family)
MRATLPILALSLLVSLRALAAPLVPLPPQPSDVPWPTETWPTGALPATVNKSVVDAALSVTARKDPALGETRAVVIVHHGRIVAEQYAPGYSADTRLISWSMAKSVTQALVGIAVRDKLVDIDKPMGNGHWAADDPRQKITWRQWEQMVDGQDYHEIDRFDEPTRNDAARMLFGQGRLDVAAFAAALPLVHAPGTHWNYNSAGVNLVSAALANVLAPGSDATQRRARMHEVLAKELFGPLGMKSATPEFDAQGNFIGSAFVYATARDFARFGLLYLRDGMWEGKRILPEGWVDFARTRGPAPNSGLYGAGFWLTPAPDDAAFKWAMCPHGPRDLFMAQGHEGQLIIIVPSKDLVLVRLGLLNDMHFGELGKWTEELVNLFPDGT